MKNRALRTTTDLLPSERRFRNAMSDLQFGHFQDLRICNGQLVLDPAPMAVRQLKFGKTAPAPSQQCGREFVLKQAVIDFFQHVRAIEHGRICLLQIQNGLPVLAEEETALVTATKKRHKSGT